VDDLPAGVHAAVGASGSGHADRLAGDRGDSAFEAVL
jgi:hypothetical protein